MTTARGANSEDGFTMELGSAFFVFADEGPLVAVCRGRGTGSRGEGMAIDSSPWSASESALNIFRLISGKLCTSSGFVGPKLANGSCKTKSAA